VVDLLGFCVWVPIAETGAVASWQTRGAWPRSVLDAFGQFILQLVETEKKKKEGLFRSVLVPLFSFLPLFWLRR
jgi:hypothetical protein